MEYEWWVIILLILGGLVAGIINTFAGNGSIITLTVLSEMAGLPLGIANGTNRVGVFLQVLVGLRTFLRSEKTNLSGVWKITIPTVLGSIVGAYVAVWVGKTDEIWLGRILAGIMILMLFLVLKNPKQWIKPNPDRKNLPLFWLVLIFFAVGFYGGFIQAGVGVIMLVVLMSATNYDLTNANAIKLFLTLLLNIPAFLIFIWEGQVAWMAGLVLAIGQMAGAAWAAKFALNDARANYWIRSILIGIIIIAILRFSGVGAWIVDTIGMLFLN